MINPVCRMYMEGYQKQRLAESSRVHPGKTTTPCEVNKEVTGLKVIFNRAIKHDKLKVNSIANFKSLPENNIRAEGFNNGGV
jgi:hypothetical protein